MLNYSRPVNFIRSTHLAGNNSIFPKLGRLRVQFLNFGSLGSVSWALEIWVRASSIFELWEPAGLILNFGNLRVLFDTSTLGTPKFGSWTLCNCKFNFGHLRVRFSNLS